MLLWDSWGSSATRFCSCLFSAPPAIRLLALGLISTETNCDEVSGFTSGLRRTKAYVQANASNAKTESPWATLSSLTTRINILGVSTDMAWRPQRCKPESLIPRRSTPVLKEWTLLLDCCTVFPKLPNICSTKTELRASPCFFGRAHS